MNRTPVGSPRWILTLASLTGMIALSIDMSLPAQPTLARAFGVEAEVAALTLSLFMLGFSVAQIFVGYLSDAIGRMPVLTAGLLVYVLAGVACAASPSIEVLIACRVLQGMAGAAGPVVVRAMIRDTQPAAAAARLLSTMLAALAVAPMIAPTIGGAILDWLGWRAIFGSLALLGAWLLVYTRATLTETLRDEQRATISARGLIRGYREFFTTRGTVLPLLIPCASFAGQFGYIACSPYVLMDGYGASSREFGLYFASTALALMCGSLVGARMLRAGRSPGAMIVTGTTILLVGGVGVLAGVHVGGLGIAGFLAPMIVYFFATGISGPSATALTMEPVPHVAGVASAAIGALTMTSGALGGYVTTKLGGSSPRVFATLAMATSVIAFGLAVVVALRRRRARTAPELAQGL